MKRVVIVSPYSGDVEENLRYLRAAMRDCLLRGESPFAGHGLFTQEGVLDDSDAEERALGMKAHHAWMDACDLVAVYTDLGRSGGMDADLLYASACGVPIEERKLPGWSS